MLECIKVTGSGLTFSEIGVDEKPDFRIGLMRQEPDQFLGVIRRQVFLRKRAPEYQGLSHSSHSDIAESSLVLYAFHALVTRSCIIM